MYIQLEYLSVLIPAYYKYFSSIEDFLTSIEHLLYIFVCISNYREEIIIHTYMFTSMVIYDLTIKCVTVFSMYLNSDLWNFNEKWSIARHVFIKNVDVFLLVISYRNVNINWCENTKDTFTKFAFKLFYHHKVFL